MIGKTLLIKGEITGSGSVNIEGKVEGSIELPDDRVTVGRNGRVSANIAGRDMSCSAAARQVIVFTFAARVPYMEMSRCRASPLKKELI
jgi:hypothetical protein